MKIYTKLLSLCTLICLGSCSWLDIEPEGQATSNKLFATGDGYRSVISGVYQAMTSRQLYGVELQFGLVDCISQQYTWDWNSNSNTMSASIYQEAADYNYQHTEVRKTIDKIWADGYNVIANANNLIQNIEQASPAIFTDGEMERDMIMGEAYACRALMHFDLCRLFAPAPIENETGLYLPYVDTYPNIQPVSIEVKPFLEKVVNDLKKAQELTAHFDTTALGQSVSASSKARFTRELDYGMEGYQHENEIDDFYRGRGFRLSYYAITALLARVYQYMGNDLEAFNAAKQVLEFKAHGVLGTTYEMFTSDSYYESRAENLEDRQCLKVPSNLIFALYNEDAYEDYSLDSYFKKRVTDNNVGQWLVLDLKDQKIFNNQATDEDELQKDYRGQYLLFVPDYESFSWNPRYISAKGYCSNMESIRQPNVEMLPVIRATEMRYIMAEHYAREKDYGEAYNLLNQIRSNRGLWDALPVKNSLEGFLDDMVRDAQREWISEGQLFYLYKRLGYKIPIKEKVPGSNTEEKINVRKMTKSEYMFPIPDNQNM